MKLKFSNKNKRLQSFGFINPLEEILEANNMKIATEKSVKLVDGKYEGVIEDIQYRTDPYAYTDVIVKIDDMTLTAGYPTKIIKDSALSMLLTRFGAKLVIGKDIEPEEFLTKGKKVKFTVVNAKAKDGKTYANIVRETLRPSE